MRLGTLLEGAGVRYCVGFRDVEVLSVADDSRRVRPGALFVAVRGAASDGHEFLRDALARGAGALVVESLDAVGCAPPGGVPVAVVSDSRAAVSRIAARFHGNPA
ncbi:MAG: Mur ligase domain-containing protein, partial [Planctomycetes bacterium]|nr:Mur ligase domain-containing protein [Planctomycetota bacterium]